LIELVKTKLSELTGIEDWEAISFGILPGEDPKGIVLPSSVSMVSQAKLKTIFMVGILISSQTLGDLSDTAQEIATLIGNSLGRAQVCLPGGAGLMRLVGEINIEIPQSYSQQSNISNTTGFFTSITFGVEVL
jgi:hypothetical protein